MLTPVSKPESPRASRGEQRHPDHGERVAVVGEQGAPPVGKGLRLGEDAIEADGHHHEVQQQVNPDYEDRDADRLPKAFQKDGAKHPQQQEGYADLSAVQKARH